jgi:hypothetical protein
MAIAYLSTESVTFFFPSTLVKTTDLDAIGLPTFRSVRAGLFDDCGEVLCHHTHGYDRFARQ